MNSDQLNAFFIIGVFLIVCGLAAVAMERKNK